MRLPSNRMHLTSRTDNGTYGFSPKLWMNHQSRQSFGYTKSPVGSFVANSFAVLGASTNVYWPSVLNTWAVVIDRNTLTGTVNYASHGAFQRATNKSDSIYPLYMTIGMRPIELSWTTTTNSSTTSLEWNAHKLGQAQPINDGLAVRCVKN